MARLSLSELKHKNPMWFSKENKRFFNDISYRVMIGRKTHKPYLIRKSYMWSDMFGGRQQLRWVINSIKENLEVGNIVDNLTIAGITRPYNYFLDFDDVKEWLKEN